SDLSDRPYREGMSDEKIEGILRNGAGKQWDPEVVNAFFNAKKDIYSISQNNATQLTIDAQDSFARLPLVQSLQ
ncbi:MAG: hypothetical protein ACWGMZ_04440, partial [Thermoguttaceae bacterium]